MMPQDGSHVAGRVLEQVDMMSGSWASNLVYLGTVKFLPIINNYATQWSRFQHYISNAPYAIGSS